MGVRVKNSYNRTAAGTLISKTRDMKDGEDLVTSIVLKRNVTLVDIVSTRMLGQIGFLAKVFEIFNTEGLSVDVVATSEVSVSLTLDPAKTLWERDLIDEELESLMAAFSVGIQHSPTRALTHSLTDSLVRSLAHSFAHSRAAPSLPPPLTPGRGQDELCTRLLHPLAHLQRRQVERNLGARLPRARTGAREHPDDEPGSQQEQHRPHHPGRPGHAHPARPPPRVFRVNRYITLRHATSPWARLYDTVHDKTNRLIPCPNPSILSGCFSSSNDTGSTPWYPNHELGTMKFAAMKAMNVCSPVRPVRPHPMPSNTASRTRMVKMASYLCVK